MEMEEKKMDPEKCAVRLEDVRKSYGRHQVLKGVTLQVNQGDIFGIVGKNGCGKTTMYKVILGLSKFQGGKVTIGNRGESLEEARKKVAFFIGSDFFDYLTARENLEYYARLKGIRDKAVISELLALVELDTAKGKFGGFSLGMKQRLGIANALMGNPEILILDEPTNGLDPKGIADIRHLIQRLNQERGITILISSHILTELEHTANRFAIIHDGVAAQIIDREDLEREGEIIQFRTDDPEKAAEILKRENIPLEHDETGNNSLEEYYFSLVGGDDNA